MNINYLATDQPSEEASVSILSVSCELLCILWATVYSVSYFALIGTSHKLPPTLYR